VVVHESPQALVVGVAPFDHAGSCRLRGAAELHLHLGLGPNVVQPSGWLVGAAIRRDHQVPAVVLGVHQGGRSGLAGAPARRPQEETWDTEQPVADAAPRLLVQPLMNAQDDSHRATLERAQTGVARRRQSSQPPPPATTAAAAINTAMRAPLPPPPESLVAAAAWPARVVDVVVEGG